MGGAGSERAPCPSTAHPLPRRSAAGEHRQQYARRLSIGRPGRCAGDKAAADSFAAGASDVRGPRVPIATNRFEDRQREAACRQRPGGAFPRRRRAGARELATHRHPYRIQRVGRLGRWEARRSSPTHRRRLVAYVVRVESQARRGAGQLDLRAALVQSESV